MTSVDGHEMMMLSRKERIASAARQRGSRLLRIVTVLFVQNQVNFIALTARRS